MNSTVSFIQKISLYLYTFSGFLLYVAGSYLKGPYYSLFLSLVFLFVLDVGFFLIGVGRTKYVEDFSTTHPQKGDAVQYTLGLVMETSLPACWIRVRLKESREDLSEKAERKSFFLFPRPRQLYRFSYTIRCKFRGIYTVGLDSLEIYDPLFLFGIRLPVYHRNFYVYPRLAELSSCRIRVNRAEGFSPGIGEGLTADPTLFQSVTEYRPGQPIRYMAWKKFAATGIPYVRQFETSSLPMITLYMDLRRKGESTEAIWESEDVSLEVLLALIRYFLLHKIPVRLRYGEEQIVFREEDPEEFQRFYRYTLLFPFGTYAFHAVSPSELLRGDVQNRSLATGAVVGIFRSFDPQVIEFLEDFTFADGKGIGIIVVTSLEPRELHLLEDYRLRMEEQDRLLLVRGYHTMKEDLG